MAGHTLVHTISSFILKITIMEFWFFFPGSIALLLILILESGVALPQAYAFTVLTCIYINDAFAGSH
jgi:F0F1-type ATP synthase membrane subunit a